MHSPVVLAPGASFLASGGEMGALMRGHNWAVTPVGRPETWPQTLKTTVRLILTSQHPMFIWWGAELTCFYNDAYSASIGPDRHPSALGRPGREVWAEIWDVIGPEIEFVMAGQGAAWHERQLIPITRGGAREDVWWTYGYSPIDDDGAATGVGGVLVICRDVTAEVRAEQAKADDAGRLRGFFEQAPGFMALLRGPDHVFELTNAAYVSLVGRDVLGKTVREALPEIEGQGFFELLDRAYATGETSTARRAPVTLASGANGASNQQFVDFVYQPIRDAAGAVSGIFIEGSVVTEAALAEDGLRASEAQFRSVLHQMPVGIGIADHEGRVTYGNPALERILRHPTMPSPGVRAYGEWGARHPDGRPYAPEEYPLARGLKGEVVEEDLARYRRGDGTEAWIRLSSIPLRDGAGRITGALAAVLDVDEAERARQVLARHQEELTRQVEERTAELMASEETLRQAQKMEAVGQLTGGIAHDFNNMLQGIAGNLDMMQRRMEQGRTAEVGRYVDAARRMVERAGTLTHRLLAFARRQSLQAEPVNPDALIAGMEDLVRRTVGPAITVELRRGGGSWAVLCDPNQLENVLLNLAINARDAMPEGGTLTIGTTLKTLGAADVAGQDGARPGGCVEILVADTGTGMDEATRARAFEPFFTTKPLGQGTGLGLSQLYGFVRQSSGVVHLDSAPGRGTTVRLCLPRQEHVRGQERSSAPEVEPEKAGAGGTVLLVEDEEGVRAMAAEYLRDLGYTVLEAGDGPAALRLLRLGSRVDLLVTDVGLPGGMNGRQIADAARERRPGLLVLFITGYAGIVLDGQLAPGMEVIGKPFALDVLVAKMRAMLEPAPAA
jgi:signal transduction histidine kinase/CheY-like chemotaxis protein